MIVACAVDDELAATQKRHAQRILDFMHCHPKVKDNALKRLPTNPKASGQTLFGFHALSCEG
jgi:hypothetical protein